MNLGAYIDFTNRGAFLYSAFENMYSSKFCGSKAADYCGTVSNCIFVLLSSTDVEETLSGFDQVFRRLFKKISSSTSNVKLMTILVKQDDSSSNLFNEKDSDQLLLRLNEIWSDINSEMTVSLNF